MKELKDFIRRMRVLVIRMLAAGKGDMPLRDRTLIVAPHPDDEVIGCGGLVTRLVERGIAPTVVILSGGGASHKTCCSLDEETLVAERRRLTLKAADVMGLPHDHVRFLDFTDGAISEDDRKDVERLRAIVDEVQPQAVLVPHSCEGWKDHLAARRMGLAAATDTMEVWEYCVWVWFYPLWHFDWKAARVLRMDRAEHATKLAAMRAYAEALAPCGRPWSGRLPKVFLWANRWTRELYFKLR